MLAQVFARQFQKHFAVGAQRVAGNGVEPCFEPLERGIERLAAFLVDLLLRFELRRQHRDFNGERLLATPSQQERDNRAQQRAGAERKADQ